jgi:hypothetical protein
LTLSSTLFNVRRNLDEIAKNNEVAFFSDGSKILRKNSSVRVARQIEDQSDLIEAVLDNS